LEASGFGAQIVEACRRRPAAGLDTPGALSNHSAVADVGTGGVERLLAAARERIERVQPAAAWAAATTRDALIVDLRSSDERRRHGIVPGSLHVPRSVLEWRADPTSPWRNPHLAGRERLILLCAEGYSSSLAAASLVELGHARAGDVVGGFHAWLDAGLPIADAPDDDGSAPGMGVPDAAVGTID
jgi:rhodanese-related sulfurtransferase